MQFGIINTSAAPVRKEPDHRSEMVNQLLFGETVAVLKHKGKRWVKIKSLHDGYEGWMNKALLQETDEPTPTAKSAFVVKKLIATAKSATGQMLISAGATLPAYADGVFKLGETNYTIDGEVLNRFADKASPEKIMELAMPWLNVPYQWGGRTPMGIDCSGLTQVFFKQLGIDLPRDAWQQAEAGEAVLNFSEAKCGDLLFFGKKYITHVGVLLPGNKMIHASGKVKIDDINEKGVMDILNGRLVLKLKIIRRYL